MAVDISSVNGYVKEVYGQLQDVIPENAQFLKYVGFKSRPHVGRNFNFTAVVGRPQGFTYLGSAGSVQTLEDPISMITREATVTPHEAMLQEDIATSLLSRATNTQDSYGGIVDKTAQQMNMSMAYRCDLEILLGQSSLGTIESVSETSATVKVLTITKATWSAYRWACLFNGYVDAFSAVGGTITNSNDALKVTAFDFANRTVTVTLQSSSDDAAMDASAGDVLVPHGTYESSTHKWGQGIDSILSDSSVHGIDSSTYPLWASNNGTASSAVLTFSKAIAECNRIIARSYPGPRKLCVSEHTWTDMMNDTALLQRLHGNSGSFSVGAKDLKYESGPVQLEVEQFPLVEAGKAYILDFDTFGRTGGTPMTFNLGDLGLPDRFAQHLENKNAVRLRCYKDDVPFCEYPGANGVITGIVNDSLV